MSCFLRTITVKVRGGRANNSSILIFFLSKRWVVFRVILKKVFWLENSSFLRYFEDFLSRFLVKGYLQGRLRDSLS